MQSVTGNGWNKKGTGVGWAHSTCGRAGQLSGLHTAAMPCLQAAQACACLGSKAEEAAAAAAAAAVHFKRQVVARGEVGHVAHEARRRLHTCRAKVKGLGQIVWQGGFGG